MAKTKPYQVPKPLADRAESEARRRRKKTGNAVLWSQVVTETLDKHLPK